MKQGLSESAQPIDFDNRMVAKGIYYNEYCF